MTTTSEQILTTLPLQVWTAQPSGSLDYVNQFVCDYFGVASETIVADGWQDFLHPSDLTVCLEAWSRALKSGNRYELEFRLLRKSDLRYRWHRSVAVAQRNKQGEIFSWVGTNTDIDDEKRLMEVRDASMEQVQIERQRVRGLFEQSPVAVATTRGPDHVFDQANKLFAELMERPTVIGKRLVDLFSPDGEFAQRVQEVYQNGGSYSTSEVRKRAPGQAKKSDQERSYTFSYQALSGVDGKPHGVMIICMDVSDLVEARQKSERLSAEREAILSQLSEGVIVTDAAGKITFVNESANQLHGIARLDVAPDNYAETYQLLTMNDAPYPSLELPLARAVLREEVVMDARWKIKRPDGSIIVAEGNARPVYGANGKKIGAVLTVRDVPNTAPSSTKSGH